MASQTLSATTRRPAAGPQLGQSALPVGTTVEPPADVHTAGALVSLPNEGPGTPLSSAPHE